MVRTTKIAAQRKLFVNEVTFELCPRVGHKESPTFVCDIRGRCLSRRKVDCVAPADF
jgi:hypothetical protein